VNGGAGEKYWERACHFFHRSAAADQPGSYLIHDKDRRSVHIGVGSQRSVAVGRGNQVRIEGSAATDAAEGAPVFKQVENLLVPDAPCFFVASPDIRRRFADDRLPRALFVNPVVEFAFTPDAVDGTVGYAADPAGEQRGRAMLRAFREGPPAPPPDDAGAPSPFPSLVAGWRAAESDDSFRQRLAQAVGLLQDHRDGKMTLTRAYERRLGTGHDPFDLYQLQSRRNGEYAGSHFFCLREGVHSLGASPENVFVLDNGTLTVDVVAATCRSGDSDEHLAAELVENPKQLKEHRSSLRSRQDRFRGFCRPGSIEVVQPMRVKRLRNVWHLHTVFSGELLPGVTAFDLMRDVFPLLGSRPRELLAVADAEQAPHRYFAGLLGRTHAGTASTFLNIRNVLLDGQDLHAKVGVGVLRESVPEAELLETQDKLSGLLEAVEAWTR
jgi:anthranilate/para-aminobenzoate synthase component I